jgi:hypothetical protein
MVISVTADSLKLTSLTLVRLDDDLSDGRLLGWWLEVVTLAVEENLDSVLSESRQLR